MSVHATQAKFKGSASALVKYYKEELDGSLGRALSYYSTSDTDTVFEHVRGKAALALDGLNLSLGLTKAQHADIHNGRWGNKQLVKGSYEIVHEMDETKGKRTPKLAKNPKTLKMEPVPKMVPVTKGRKKEPVYDPLTGKQKMKRDTKPAQVAGYDCVYGFSKDVAEFLLAHPEHTETIKRNALAAVDAANSWTESSVPLVVKRLGRVNKLGGTKEVRTVEGLLWWNVFGNSARPTPESKARGYASDIQFHVHSFVSAAAHVGNGEFRMIDGTELFRSAKTRGHLASMTFNQLNEAAGISIEYAEHDRKGHIRSEIQGSNMEVRQYFSTNSKRERQLVKAFEKTHKRPPSGVELKQMMQETKGAKTKGAKAADEVGNETQRQKWIAALERDGLELTISNAGKPRKVAPFDDRKAELFKRLERPDGIAVDLDSNSCFGPEVIFPAVAKSCEGLSFSIEELKELAEDYRVNELEPIRPANKDWAVLYTTKSILKAESVVADLLDKKAKKRVASSPENIVRGVLGTQKKSLDAEQEELVRAICGSDSIVHCAASAGSGKTHSMKPAVDALRRAGVIDRVVVVANARRRGNLTGQSVNGYGLSVEALKLSKMKFTDKTLVIVDEISQIGTFDMAAIMEKIGDARLVTIGDTKQAQAIGASGWLKEEYKHREPKTLTHDHRTKNPLDRHARELLREGQADKCLDILISQNRVFVSDTTEELVTVAQERYEHYLDNGYTPKDIAIINTGSNHYLDAMARMVQRVQVERGMISEFATFEVEEAETGRAWTLHQKEAVIFNTGTYKGLEEPIFNGTTGTIVKLEADGRCRIELDQDDRRTVTIRLDKEAVRQPIAPRCAVSTSKYQGEQVPVAITIQGSKEITSLNSGYSQFTRSTDVTEVLMSREVWGAEYPVKALAEAWSVESERNLASSVKVDRGIELDEVLRAQKLRLERMIESANDFGLGRSL